MPVKAMDKKSSAGKVKRSVSLKRRILRVCMVLAAVLLGIVLLLGITLLIMHRAGKSSLYAKAGSDATIAVNSEEEKLIAQEKAKLSARQWQSDWIVMDDRIYEYNKDLINLLFLAVDVAGGLESETDYRDWNAGQADAVFILSLNPADKTMKIVAVPRNSMVDLNIYGTDGRIQEQIRNQICLQYGYAGGGRNGLEEMKRAVSELLYQLPIHGVTAIGYDAVVQINDKVGGVEVSVLEDIVYDPEMVKGNTIRLSGEQAFLYLQYRDVTKAGSPTARLMRQKQYLTAFVSEARRQVKADPLLVTELYRSLTEYMNTDITLEEAVYMAAEILDYRFEPDGVCILEGEDRIVPFVNEEGQEDFYDDYYLYEDSIRDTVVKVFYKEVSLENQGY